MANNETSATYATVWLHIPGEYNMVAARTRDAQAMLRAHTTPISKSEATTLLQKLAREHGLGTLKIRWGLRRGRGGKLAVRSRKLAGWNRISYGPDGARVEKPAYRMVRTGPVVPYVGLPSKSMTLGGHWWDHTTNKSLLRVGLVLHEFAHAVIAVKYNRAGHGPDFVQELDNLIAAWEATS